MTEKLDEMFTRAVGTMRVLERTAVGPPEGPEGARRLLEVCDAQLGSRHLDLAAPWLQVHGRGYYTIGSSATRATQPWPRHCIRPTQPCCTTARVRSSSSGPDKGASRRR